MPKATIDEKTIRDQLKAKRNLLIDEFSKNPMNTRLAIEIRLIDDQIAEVTQHLVQQWEVGIRSGRNALRCSRVTGDVLWGLIHFSGYCTLIGTQQDKR
jgi:hypothetical protein